MYVYIYAFILSIGLSALAVIAKNKNKRLLFLFFAVSSMLPTYSLSAFRYEVGTDFKSYQLYFYYIQRGAELSGLERGYYYLTKLSTYLTEDPTGFFVLSSLVVCGCVYLAIYQQSINPPLSIFLFFGTSMYFVSLNGVRQMMAAAVLIFSFRYLQNRNWKRFFLGVFLAILFHESAVIFMPVYFIVKLKLNPKKVVQYLLLLALAFPVVDQIIYFFSSLMGYSGYFASSFNTGQFEVWFFLINGCVLGLATFFYPKGKNDFKYQCYYWMQMIAFITTALSSFIPLANRITWYFMFIQIISMPYFLKAIPHVNLKKFVTLSVIVSYFCVVFIGIGIQGSHGAVPYQSIF